MQSAVELEVQGLVLRGMSHIPDGESLCPAVILFHGYTGNKVEAHFMFVKLSRRLESIGFAVFRFDFSGSGESDGAFQDMTLGREVEEAKAILDYVRGHERVHPEAITLCGLSMGGLVASLVAGDRPQDVAKLVLLAPAGNMKDIVMEKAKQNGMDEGSIPDVFDDGGNLVGLAFALDVLGTDVYPRAAHYKGPVLLVHGTEDATVDVRAAHDYQQEAYDNRATLYLIEGADHTFNKNQWEEKVIEAVSRFLTDQEHA